MLLNKSISHVNAGVFVPVNFGMWNRLEAPELWHAEVVPVEDANGALVTLPIAIVWSTKYSYNLEKG